MNLKIDPVQIYMKTISQHIITSNRKEGIPMFNIEFEYSTNQMNFLR